MIRKSFVSCVITCATDGSQDDEFTRLKEGKLCHEILKVQEDKEGDKDDDRHMTVHNVGYFM